MVAPPHRPATGDPGGAGLRAVTVAGSDPAWAEVWSKALFLEGRRGIASWRAPTGWRPGGSTTGDELG